MITPLHHMLSQHLTDICRQNGISQNVVKLAAPERADADAATGIARQVAHKIGRPALTIAEQIATALREHPGVASALAVAPGYVNLQFQDSLIEQAIDAMLASGGVGIPRSETPQRIVVDFGGPNIKPMHVGHLRSLVIGEALRRILQALGHNVISDIHLGDWGLPSGMVLSALQLQMPDAPWFGPGPDYPSECPIDLDDLARIYPDASTACSCDESRMALARATTLALQEGDPGLSVLWGSIVALAKGAVLRSCQRLHAHFDLLLGESDVADDLGPLLVSMEKHPNTRRDGGALIMDVADPGDRKDVPPLVLQKGDGCALYATTDLATIAARVQEHQAERIIYVVDARQALHFTQVFRAARLVGMAEGVVLEHVPFGTVKGSDKRPLRTRMGANMPLDALLDLARDEALERLQRNGAVPGEDTSGMDEDAEAIGITALKIADLSSRRMTGYVLDLDRAVSFEGYTGPYLLYTLIRLRSILGRADAPLTDSIRVDHAAARQLALICLAHGGAVQRSAETLDPYELTEWAFRCAGSVSRFYAECAVLAEADPQVRASRLNLCCLAERCLASALQLLGCPVPSKM